MKVAEKYHPERALENPREYYRTAFENYPRRLVVPVVGNLAMALARPTVSFHGAETADEYFGKIEDGTSMVLTFTHRGTKKFHDPGAAAATVFGSQYLRSRVQNINVWAAIPYMTDKMLGPVIQSVGGVPVIRSEDWKRYGLNPSEKDKEAVKNDGLLDHSEQHLDGTGNILAIFPAGTRGAQGIRDGVGLVLERLTRTVTLPVAMVSDSEQSGNIPRNLRVAFGEPVPTDPVFTAADYRAAIDLSQQVAIDSIT